LPSLTVFARNTLRACASNNTPRHTTSQLPSSSFRPTRRIDNFFFSRPPPCRNNPGPSFFFFFFFAPPRKNRYREWISLSWPTSRNATGQTLGPLPKYYFDASQLSPQVPRYLMGLPHPHRSERSLSPPRRRPRRLPVNIWRSYHCCLTVKQPAFLPLSPSPLQTAPNRRSPPAKAERFLAHRPLRSSSTNYHASHKTTRRRNQQRREEQSP